MTAGVVLAWQQQPDGQWYALVSAWLPGASVTPRQQDDRPVPPASSPR